MDLKLNEKQSIIFNSVFKYVDNKLVQRDDCPREIAYWGGFRSGKSFVTNLILYLLAINYPGMTACVIRNFYTELLDSSLKQLKDDFGAHGQFTVKGKPADAIFKNGSTINYRSFSDDASKIKSTNYDVVLMCQAEECDYDVFVQAIGRLSGQNVVKPFIMTEGNPSESWAKDRYKERNKKELDEDNILFVEGTTYDNQSNISKDYIPTLLKVYDQEFIDRYVLGSWNMTSSRIYTALADHHKMKPLYLQKNWYKCVAFDHGVASDSALVWLCKDDHNNIYVYDEWHKKNASLNDIASAATANGRLPIIFDTSIKNTQTRGGDNFGSVYGDLAEKGLWLIDAIKKDKTANILLVNSLLHQHKLHFFDHCSYTWSQHQRYKFKKGEEIFKKDDHAVDCVQYGVRYLKNITVERPAISRAINNSRPTLHDYVQQNYKEA